MKLLLDQHEFIKYNCLTNKQFLSSLVLTQLIKTFFVAYELRLPFHTNK